MTERFQAPEGALALSDDQIAEHLPAPSYHDGFGRSPDLWSLAQIGVGVRAALAAQPEWRCPDTGRTCTAEDCSRECVQAQAEGFSAAAVDADEARRLADQLTQDAVAMTPAVAANARRCASMLRLAARRAAPAEGDALSDDTLRDMARVFGFNEYEHGRWVRSTYTPAEIIALLRAAIGSRKPQPKGTPCDRCDTPMACREHEPGKFCPTSEAQAPAPAPALTDMQIDKLLHALDDVALNFGDDLPGLALNSRGLERSREVVRRAFAAPAVGAQLAAFRASQQEAGIPNEDLMPAEPALAVAYLIANVKEWQ